jgi:hypothetical protein
MGNPSEAFGLKVGDRIELVSMGEDPCPMDPGATGTVTGFCDSTGLEQVQVKWDPQVGRSLNLIPCQDTWRVLKEG